MRPQKRDEPSENTPDGVIRANKASTGVFRKNNISDACEGVITMSRELVQLAVGGGGAGSDIDFPASERYCGSKRVTYSLE